MKQRLYKMRIGRLELIFSILNAPFSVYCNPLRLLSCYDLLKINLEACLYLNTVIFHLHGAVGHSFAYIVAKGLV